MARARRSASNKKRAATSDGGDGTFSCPECGKAFTRAASLGAHRNRAHGVSGASKRRTRASSARNGGATRRGAGKQTRTRTTRERAGASSSAGRSVNRDALLQALFPNGLPAREEVIRRANAWLDEAEQLARTK